MTVRSNLKYNEEVHLLVKNSIPKRLFEAMVYSTQDDKKEKEKEKRTSSWSSVEAKFLVRRFEVPRNLISRELP